MKKSQLLGSGMLLAAAVIWGCALVAQSVAMDSIGPFTFGAVRFLLGAITLIPILPISAATQRRQTDPPSFRRRDLVISGLLCGVVLFFASSAQQIGIIYATAGKAGFITTLYVVFVPIAGWILFRKKLSPLTAVSVIAALAGLYLLCVKGDAPFQAGDLWLVASALLYTVHILVVDRFAAKVDGVKLSCAQFLVSAVLCAVVALIRERGVTLAAIGAAWWPLAYVGILSSGVGYTFQILGQQRTHPVVASLLMSLESVFAAMAGALFLQERLTPRELCGCILMFAAVITAQISPAVRSRRKM